MSASQARKSDLPPRDMGMRPTAPQQVWAVTCSGYGRCRTHWSPFTVANLAAPTHMRLRCLRLTCGLAAATAANRRPPDASVRGCVSESRHLCTERKWATSPAQRWSWSHRTVTDGHVSGSYTSSRALLPMRYRRSNLDPRSQFLTNSFGGRLGSPLRA
ncbi:hypothetical protein HDA40_001966 [Hamadaea flava]|nr:hypothetical protein [Hamadaea flava]